jgi:hypothetical protein
MVLILLFLIDTIMKKYTYKKIHVSIINPSRPPEIPNNIIYCLLGSDQPISLINSRLALKICPF